MRPGIFVSEISGIKVITGRFTMARNSVTVRIRASNSSTKSAAPVPNPVPTSSVRSTTAIAHGRIGLTLDGLIVWAVTLP